MSLLLFAACSEPVPADSAPDPLCACPNLALPSGPIPDEAGLAALLGAVLTALYPDMADAQVGVAAVDDLAFFRAWVELDTIDAAPIDRAYTIQYDPTVLSDPPDPASIAAILAHELGHVEDYVAMDKDELVQFAVWYGTTDWQTSDELAVYERATDEKALARGCAAGLSSMRTWIYAHSTDEVLAEKLKDYYTPDEITAWVSANGECAT